MSASVVKEGRVAIGILPKASFEFLAGDRCTISSRAWQFNGDGTIINWAAGGLNERDPAMKQDLSTMPKRLEAGGVCIQAQDWGDMGG